MSRLQEFFSQQPSLLLRGRHAGIDGRHAGLRFWLRIVHATLPELDERVVIIPSVVARRAVGDDVPATLPAPHGFGAHAEDVTGL